MLKSGEDCDVKDKMWLEQTILTEVRLKLNLSNIRRTGDNGFDADECQISDRSYPKYTSTFRI